jgi:hypothetical protein
MNVTIKETKQIECTPELLAKIFWNLDNDEQAEFFDSLSIIAGDKLDEQMEIVAYYTDGLSNKALYAMREIGKRAAIRIQEMDE